MDKLTIKQKAEAYDKAIEKLRNFYRDYDTVSLLINVKEELANMFPEIKESKDEQIRQRIIHALHGDVLEMSEIKEAIDWLEKQDEEIIPLKESILNVWELGNYWKELTKGICNTEHGTQLDYIVKHWKDGEHYIKSFNKQGEKKPANKVEPKFHKGDWVVTDKCDTVQIEAVNNGYYTLYNGMIFTVSYVDKCWHRWTIADAKPGDVLTLSYASKNYILIYKRLYEKGINIIMSVCCFYCVEKNEYYDETDNFHVMNNGEIITPATYEQLDLLFAKMKEAGYEWDTKRKELKKIDSKPIFDAEIPFGAKDSELEEVFYSIPNGFHAEIKDDKVVIKKGEQKSWSKEDENRFKNLIELVEQSNEGKGTKEGFVKFINRLHSIKDRIQAKQESSDEHYELEEFAKIVRCNLTGISKAVQKLFEAKYLQLTGNKMYGGLKD